MMRCYLTTLTLALFTTSIAQVSFEQGYVVYNNGDTLSCQIKFQDWNDSPERISIRHESDNQSYIVKLDTIRSFGIGDVTRYERYLVSIDLSSSNIEELSETRAPELIEQPLVLRVLVKGEASLYMYKKEGRSDFFYSIGNAGPEQLAYKKYRASNGNILTNNDFREQIWAKLQCSTIDRGRIDDLRYNVKSLGDIFAEYNQCTQNDYEHYVQQNRKGSFHLTVQPAFRFSEMVIETNWESADYGLQNNFAFGFEVEYVLPFNKNKWGLFTAPLYQSYSGSHPVYLYESDLEYQSVELAMGLRHYFFLGANSAIYVDVATVVDIPWDSQLIIGEITFLDIETKSNIAAGVGFKFLNRFSAEVRHGFSREIEEYPLYPDSKYTSWTLLLGYSIF